MINKTTKTLAITCFILVLSALASALISDAIVVGQAILGFALALVISIVVFFFAIICMFISIVLVFGIYLLENNGFWPIDWAKNAFDEVMKDYEVTQGQLNDLFVIRIILLVVCIAAFVIAIIAIKRIKKEKKKEPSIKVVPYKGFAISSLVFSILGIIACGSALAVLYALI